MYMRTWLFTWNPKRWQWDDKYDGYLEMKHQIAQVGRDISLSSSEYEYSLNRISEDSETEIASGFAATDVFEGPHWDPERAAAGDSCKRIFIEFDRILDVDNDAIVPIDLLKNRFPSVCWSSQSSGIQIPANVATDVETIWMSV